MLTLLRTDFCSNLNIYDLDKRSLVCPDQSDCIEQSGNVLTPGQLQGSKWTNILSILFTDVDYIMLKPAKIHVKVDPISLIDLNRSDDHLQD